MSTVQLTPAFALLVVTACANSAPPPAAAASPSASDAPVATADAQPAAVDADGGAKTRGDLEAELARIDASLDALARRLQTAQEGAKGELQHQLAILQQRDADLKAQIQAAGSQAGSETDKVRREFHRALNVLDGDMKKLEKQLSP